MTIEVHQIPVLTDNYIYILHEKEKNQTAVVDPALEKPVSDFLKKKGYQLNLILNTHHHGDHIGGNLDIKKKWGVQIYGYEKDAHRIAGIDRKLKENEVFLFGSSKVQVLFVPGHTSGHIAFYFPKEKYLFCGDTLFAMGCGYLFEGSYKEMFESLQKIKNLPEDTQVFCAHEYTEKNASFALSVNKSNLDLQKRFEEVKKLRREKKTTIPFYLKEELLTNPFLRAKNLSEFTILREKKNQF